MADGKPLTPRTRRERSRKVKRFEPTALMNITPMPGSPRDGTAGPSAPRHDPAPMDPSMPARAVIGAVTVRVNESQAAVAQAKGERLAATSARQRHLQQSMHSMLHLFDLKATSGPRETAAAARLHSEYMDQVGRMMAAVLSLEPDMGLQSAIARVSAVAADVMRCDHAQVYLADGSDELLTYVRSIPHRIPRASGIIGECLSTMRACNVPDVHAHAGYDAAIDRYLNVNDCRSLLVVPIVTVVDSGENEAKTDETVDKLVHALEAASVARASGQAVHLGPEVLGRDGERRLVGVVRLMNKRGGGGTAFSSHDETLACAYADVIAGFLDATRRVERTTTRLAQDSALLSLARELSSELNLEQLMRLIMEQAREMLMADRCALFLCDWDANELWAPFHDGSVGTIRFPIDKGIAGWVASNGQPLNITDAYEDERFNKAGDTATGYRTMAILCMPIRDPYGRVIGVTQMLNKRGGVARFTSDDEALLDMYSIFSGIGLHNSQLYDQSVRESKKARTLLQVSTALSSTLQLFELIQVIMQSARKLLNADRCTLFLIDEETGDLVSRLSSGTGEIRIPRNAGIAGHVATSGTVLNIADAYTTPLFNQNVDTATGYRTKSILCMPITNRQGVVMGVTQMINKRLVRRSDTRPRTAPRISSMLESASTDEEDEVDGEWEIGVFGAEDEALLRAFSSEASMAIVNSQLFRNTEAMRAYLDSVLHCISSTVITIGVDRHIVKTNNGSLCREFLPSGLSLERLKLADWLGEEHEPIQTAIEEGLQGRDTECFLYEFAGRKGNPVAIRFTVSPLADEQDDETIDTLTVGGTDVARAQKRGGVVLVLEDISPQQRMMMTLTRYMSAAKASKVLEEEKNVLGGALQKATVMFSDMRNYTALSQYLNATEIITFLNAYFAVMAEPILEHGGVIDKYIGDCIMAVFGSPFPDPSDARNSVRAALGMVRGVDAFNDLRHAQGITPIVHIGVGLATGDVVSGNLGTDSRMDFTCIGHVVNLSSRIEGTTKRYGCSVLVDEATHEEVRNQFVTRDVDYVRVPGVHDPIYLFEVITEIGNESAMREPLRSHLATYKTALALYRARNFAAARASFQKLLLFGEDKPSRMYLERCDQFAENAPPRDWDGAQNWTEK